MGEGMKTVIVIGDGMADRPLKELNYLTSLEAAGLKSMDRLASSGISGLLHPISPGVVPGSDVANLAILGYDPYKVYTGRHFLAFYDKVSREKFREKVKLPW
jgi:2,3-bisphosphoglycerate-independent phosphoglycerate mutase